MLQSVVHSSENGNFYLYNNKLRLSMLIHPLLGKICNTPTIKDAETDSYYLSKYKYLKNNGFFSKRDSINMVSEINETIVKDCLITTPQIVFEVTDSCNLRCMYCAQGELYESFGRKSEKELDVDSAIKFLKYLFDLFPYNPRRKLGIGFYGGEPLLNIGFIKRIVEIIPQLNAEKQIEISFLMTTNATLVHKYIDFLVENNFKLLISLDGNRENHSYRVFSGNRVNSFERVINNIDLIRDKYPTYFINNVNFNAVLHNRNSVKDIYEFIYEKYNKIPRIAELNLGYVKPSEYGILENMFHDKRKSEMEYSEKVGNKMPHSELTMYNELIHFLKYISVNYYIAHIQDVFHQEEKIFPTSTCLPFSKKTFLTNRGDIMICERIGSDYILGNVDCSVELDLKNITKQYCKYYKNLKKVCQKCYAYRFCGICMFQMRKFEGIKNGTFVCDYFYDKKRFQEKLNQIFSFLEKNPSDFFEILENFVIEE